MVKGIVLPKKGEEYSRGSFKPLFLKSSFKKYITN